MPVTARISTIITTALALSLILRAGPMTVTPTFVFAASSPPTSAPISTGIFFTDPNINRLPLDRLGNPKVDAAVVISQVCTGYSGKHHTCDGTADYYTVENTTPGQLLVWINITRTSGAALQSLRLNETLPADWAVSATRVYYANTTRISTDLNITQPSTINFLTRTPNVLRLAIPNFNTTGIGHPLLTGQSLLVSVKLNYGLVGKAERNLGYPKNYTDVVTAAAWTQKSFDGTESTTSMSAFFAIYGTYSGPESAPPRPLLDTVLSVLPLVGFTALVIALGFGMVALASRRRRSRGYPTSTPQQ
jgi:hypothetical protein